VHGVDYVIVDIGMRMLQPRELYRAQGFPESYVIDIQFKGKALPKDAQVRMVGNSVCPPVAAAIIRANFSAQQQREFALAGD
jgi:DNA (cytosine-5)-methyltransferase 1